ncbi:MAG TPA: hypothetical protein VFS10_02470 [Pyrinomonadaceae bacterium]|nr:hypothetical protein [Pyrinomonadaceae bacterium]
MSRPARIPRPPGVANRLVRYILGFGVGVSVGLAPYLGVYKIPLFHSMLTLIPSTLREPLLPLSAALMGLLAVAVQWYEGENVSPIKLKKLFKRTLVFAFSTLLLLFVIHRFVVLQVPTFGGNSVAILKGFVRPDKQPCGPDISDLECIRRVTLDEAKINSFWGDGQVRTAGITLSLLYLLFTGAFGTLVGLIILRELVVKRRASSEP